MSTPTLAFLQNFYTDVTLYLPAEPTPTPTERVSATLPAVAEALTAPLPSTAAAKMPAPEPTTAPIEAVPTARQPPAPLPPARLPAAANVLPMSPPVAPAEVTPAPAVPPLMLTTFATLGSNKQGVVLLTRLPHEQFLKLPRNVFLNKLLQALNLVMADVVLVNVESELPVALVNLRGELAATHILAFGKNLLDVALRNTQIYEPVQFPAHNLCFLASATVESVEYDVSLKKRLWPGLQRMFLK